ncbi:predicted protein [Uncinocarpus reesii 1704]|uniref:Uncharacterized protein n=1 Tax=Uncinocarpus reesii (strain UAMH 1704) TaxID=336963 RepID=C4JWK4_UNCRE|nr:uncharacterized protein UREG_06946 [Uncinocarpus reesii 1704]EEP82081.1 predicted protein [Uncinocarpus reesii 1704]
MSGWEEKLSSGQQAGKSDGYLAQLEQGRDGREVPEARGWLCKQERGSGIKQGGEVPVSSSGRMKQAVLLVEA